VEGTSYKGVLTVTCAASGYSVFRAQESTSTAEAAKNLAEIMAILGPPRVMHTDGGPEVSRNLLRELNDIFQIEQRVGVPYHPQSNGIVERNHSIFLGVLRKLRTKNWVTALPFIQLVINNRFDRTRNTSPFFMFHGRACAPLIDFTEATRTINDERLIIQAVLDRTEKLQRVRSAHIVHLERAKLTDRTSRDNVTPTIPTLEVGQVVYLRRLNPSSKLDKVFEGPFRISKVHANGSYSLEDAETHQPFPRPVTIEMLKLADMPKSTVKKLQRQLDPSINEHTLLSESLDEPSRHGRIRRPSTKYSDELASLSGPTKSSKEEPKSHLSHLTKPAFGGEVSNSADTSKRS